MTKEYIYLVTDEIQLAPICEGCGPNAAPIMRKEEIVRCKDCRFWDEMPSSSYAPYLHRCRWLDIASRAEFFCQQGMKKDDHS